MTREEAFNLLNTLIRNPNLIKHHLAAEAVMKSLANYFKINPRPGTGEIDTEKWGLVGLLHDADYEITKSNPKRHGLVLEERLKEKLSPDVIYAIKAHNYNANGIEPKSLMDWSLYCADELTGIIIAGVLVSPDKKLSSLTSDFIFNRFNEKSFAKGANREQVKMCQEKLGIPLREFMDISLKAMQGISLQLGF